MEAQTLSPSVKRPIELVAVINSFNRRELLEDAVSSLAEALKEAPFGSAIVVFEAGSSDGSKEFLETWRTRNSGLSLTILTSSDDRSAFSDGINIGCAAAITQFPQCRWLLLYETDNWFASAKPLGEAISLLKTDPSLAAAGFTVRRHDGTFCGYGMKFPSYASFAAGQNLTLRLNLDPPNESTWRRTENVRWRTCDVVFTSPLLIRRTAWEQTGGFDAECFPFSDSDLDWAWRCAKAGWQTAVIASESVVHDNRGQASAGSANRVIDFHRSRLRLLKRHRGGQAILVKPLLFLRHLLEAIVFACKVRFDPTSKVKLAKRREMLRSVWADYS